MNKEILEKRHEVRFWGKVGATGFCWLWDGELDRHGYGVTSRGGRNLRAHRWAYEHLVGPIPEGLQIDHLCRIRNCVNPDHLEPVTNAENQARRKRDKSFITPEVKRRALGICRGGHVLADVGVLKSSRLNSKGEPYVRERCRACQHEIQERNRLKNGIKSRGKRGAYGARKGTDEATVSPNILNLYRDVLRSYHETHPEPLTRDMVA